MASQSPAEPGRGIEGGGSGVPEPRQRPAGSVRQVQEVQPCHHVGATTSVPDSTPGLLEDPNGVGVLHAFGRVICTCGGARIVIHEDVIEGKPINWYEWHIGNVVFSRAATMLYLHGATLQQLFAPFVLLRAHPRPAYDPAPGADDVLVAVVPDELLDELPLPKLFAVLSSRIGAS